MATVTSQDGTTIAYDRVGNGPTVILVDGASSFRAFGPMPELAALLASDFSVITYDRRGRGESTDTAPYAVEREVEDLGALIAAAGGPACLYGFSSGAILALQAAALGLPVRRLALLEPPLSTDAPPDAPPDPRLADTIREHVVAGRRGDAVAAFQQGIGVPEDMTAGMRQSPMWPTLESIAHTLVYDLTITPSLSVARLHDIQTPALVLASDKSDDRLLTWAQGVGDALPNGETRRLPGGWHGVSADVLAPVLTDFFKA